MARDANERREACPWCRKRGGILPLRKKRADAAPSDRPELCWKLLDEFVVLSAGTGSFDCVRLRLTSLRMTRGGVWRLPHPSRFEGWGTTDLKYVHANDSAHSSPRVLTSRSGSFYDGEEKANTCQPRPYCQVCQRARVLD